MQRSQDLTNRRQVLLRILAHSFNGISKEFSVVVRAKLLHYRDDALLDVVVPLKGKDACVETA